MTAEHDVYAMTPETPTSVKAAPIRQSRGAPYWYIGRVRTCPHESTVDILRLY